MNAIFKKQFNNYFNRKFKYFDDLESYLSGDNYILSNFNFNQNDGINTSQVVGTGTNPVDWETEGNPDYMVAYEENKIISRWFVLECTRIRKGQYRITLRRDVLADHIKTLYRSPMFIEKASVPYDNDLIFNSEGCSFNQIKREEILLQDETKNKWIVGYLDRTARDETKLPEVSVTSSLLEAVEISSLPIELNDPSDPSKGAKVKVLKNDVDILGVAGEDIGNPFYTYHHEIHVFTDNNYKITSSSNNGYYATLDVNYKRPFAKLRGLNSQNVGTLENKWLNASTKYKSDLMSSLDFYFNNLRILTGNESDDVFKYNGQILKSTEKNKYYRMEITKRTNFSKIEKEYSQSAPLIRLYNTQRIMAKEIVDNPSPYEVVSSDLDTKTYELKYKYEEVEIAFYPEAVDGTVKVTLSNNRQSCLDAPYDMFCMPFSLSNLALANEMPSKFGAFLYDLQILPYCPARFMITNGEIDESLGVEGIDFSHIATHVGGKWLDTSYVLYCRKTSDSFIINKSLSIPKYSDNLALNLKISNECDMYRIVSPNYNGAFEFSVAKNGGAVNYFEVDITYKPYTPYIHVAPKFARMYGRDFDDARGLIVNGDFSINMISDAWRNYEIANKNYQNIFDSNIKTLDLQNALGLGRNISRATLGITGAGIAGGAMTSNPMVGVGSILGSAMGSAIDLGFGQASYYAGRDNSIRQFEYQLGNVKAMPNTLNKVSAYNINNKYFPFVEVYSCSDAELEIMKNKLKWEGMTINAIGTLAEYLGNPNFNFFKARIIRLDDLKEDTHYLSAINEELMKGVYFNE